MLASDFNNKLQALEIRMKNNLISMFRNAVFRTCHYMQSATRLVTTTLASNPTLTARYLTNHTYIYATLTGNLLTVYSCQAVDE